MVRWVSIPTDRHVKDGAGPISRSSSPHSSCARRSSSGRSSGEPTPPSRFGRPERVPRCGGPPSPAVRGEQGVSLSGLPTRHPDRNGPFGRDTARSGRPSPPLAPRVLAESGHTTLTGSAPGSRRVKRRSRCGPAPFRARPALRRRRRSECRRRPTTGSTATRPRPVANAVDAADRPPRRRIRIGRSGAP